MNQINLDQLKELADLIYYRNNNLSGTAYLVGGSVRDSLLNRPSKDYDVEVYGLDATALFSVLREFAGKYKLKVNTVGAAFTVFKIGENLDVSLPRREKKTGEGHRGFTVQGDPNMTCEEAAGRRDFTINAMMMDIRSGEILDFFGGRQDLRHGIVRHINGKAFVEDSLRVLRAARFASTFNFSVDPHTVKLCQSIDLSDLPAERVWSEFERMLTGYAPADALFWLEMLGVSKQLFPELHALVGVPQEAEWHPEGSVDVHTAQVVMAAEQLTRSMSPGKRLAVIVGALCHDFGKATTTKMENGRWRALGHAEAGVEPTIKFMERLKLSSKDGFKLSEVIPKLVKYHLVPFELYRTRDKTNVASAIRRLANKVDLELLYLVNKSDALGRFAEGHPLPSDEASEWFFEEYSKMEINTAEPIPRLFTGKDLIQMGVSPGKWFGHILNVVYDAQLDGNVTSKEEAKSFAFEAIAAGSESIETRKSL